MAFDVGRFGGSWKFNCPKPANPGVRPTKVGITLIPLIVRVTVDVACDNPEPPGAGLPVPGLFVIAPMPVKYIVTFCA